MQPRAPVLILRNYPPDLLMLVVDMTFPSTKVRLCTSTIRLIPGYIGPHSDLSTETQIPAILHFSQSFNRKPRKPRDSQISAHQPYRESLTNLSNSSLPSPIPDFSQMKRVNTKAPQGRQLSIFPRNTKPRRVETSDDWLKSTEKV